MKRDIIVVDNFYENPDAVRKYAVNRLKNNSYSPFVLPEQQVPGHKTDWKTTCFQESKDCPFKSSKELIEKLQLITNEQIDLDSWNATYPTNEKGEFLVTASEAVEGMRSGKYSSKWNCCFHWKAHQGHALGQGVHTHSNNDAWSNVMDNGWAGLVYLNPRAPINSGLNLFKNKLGRDHRFMTPKEEWQLEDSLGAIYNRLILVRGKKPHCGADGFHESIEIGRIFQTLFFKIKDNQPQELESVKIFK